MAEPINLNDFRQGKGDATIGEPVKMPRDGGDGGGMDGTEARLKRLEDDGKEMRADLKAIMNTLAEIKGTMSGLSTKGELGDVRVAIGKLETRVDKLPTMTKLSVLAGLIVAAMTIVIRWNEIWALFQGAPAL